jgi:hypothetical protein
MMAGQQTMLTRACAVWLVVLIVAPFSAPFSVCDVETFFDVQRMPPSSAPVKAARTAATVNDATTHTLPVLRTKPRVKVMDAVRRPSAWWLARATAVEASRRGSVPFANSPLVSPLRI